jgi:hypothetical protein
MKSLTRFAIFITKNLGNKISSSAGTLYPPLAQVRTTAEMQPSKVRWGFCGASYKRAIKIKESKPPPQVRGKLLHFKKVRRLF